MLSSAWKGSARFWGGQETLSKLDRQTSNVNQNQRGNTGGYREAKIMFSDFIRSLFPGFGSYFSPVTLATFIFRVNNDAKESCVYLQNIHTTEHALASNFAAEILPSMQIRVAHMPQRTGGPSWYYCFRKLTHQKKKKREGHIQGSICIYIYIHTGF